MRKMRAALGMAGLIAGWPASPAFSHCTAETAPTLDLQIPRDGMSIEKVCWAGFELCKVDTFYREELLQELVDNFQKFQHVVFAYPDSLLNYLQMDTVRFDGQFVGIDTGNAESLWVNIFRELKGTMPRQNLLLHEKYPAYIPDKPYNTSYLAIVDTPFIAFFDTYATPYDLGIGPLDGCFFEPSVYMIRDGRIYKKSSWELQRMPGIWVSGEDFFKAVGLPVEPMPQPHPASIRIPRIARDPHAGPFLRAAPRRRTVFLHDLRGKRLGRLFPEADPALRGDLPMGWYFLSWQGAGGMESRAVFFPGGRGLAEAVRAGSGGAP